MRVSIEFPQSLLLISYLKLVLFTAARLLLGKLTYVQATVPVVPILGFHGHKLLHY